MGSALRRSLHAMWIYIILALPLPRSSSGRYIRLPLDVIKGKGVRHF